MWAMLLQYGDESLRWRHDASLSALLRSPQVACSMWFGARGGEGNPHMKGVGMLAGNFELNP